MKQLKILHVTFNMSIGGTEQVIRQLLKTINDPAYDLSIVCLDNQIGELGNLLQNEGFKIYKLNRDRKGLDLNLIYSLHHFIKENCIDILHCHQYTPYTYGLLASIATKARVIFTEHGRFYPDRYKLKRFVLNRVFSYMTSAITAISNSTANALAKYENFPRKKIQTIYNGISDLSVFTYNDTIIKSQLNIQDSSVVLGTVSRLDPIKNQEMMIYALENIHQTYPNVILLIVGDGPSKDTLYDLAERLKIDDSVIFTGFRLNTHDYLNIMDIFLLPSLSEGTSMTLLEAMSLSKPCVVTNVGGNPEIVLDGITGFVVPSNNQTMFTHSIIELIKDFQLRKSMGNSARLRFNSEFTSKKMANTYEQLYRDVKPIE